MTVNETIFFDKPIKDWEYLGIAIPRGAEGSYDADITGDPCIVWDEEVGLYRMFYFALNRGSKGSNSCNAHAVSSSSDKVGAGQWNKIGPVEYTNPELLLGGHTHKPWILMDPYRSNYPARINDSYMLFTVSYLNEQKSIQAAYSTSLQGPWTILPEPVILPGHKDSFDGYHADTVTAYWFEERGEILVFYKGYPANVQADQTMSPWGSSLCAATMKYNQAKASKIGKLIAPIEIKGHWMSGWVSGIQIFPSQDRGWFGLMTGSPTAPVPVSEEPYIREPAPSLAGWAYTPEEYPISQWKPDDEPILKIEDIPQDAVEDGMGVNLWRHHILTVKNGDRYLFCNSGSYGNERMFVRKAVN